jgi:hypothetical protein
MCKNNGVLKQKINVKKLHDPSHPERVFTAGHLKKNQPPVFRAAKLASRYEGHCGDRTLTVASARLLHRHMSPHVLTQASVIDFATRILDPMPPAHRRIAHVLRMLQHSIYI